VDQINTAPRKPLRLWPGILAVALQWLAWMVAPLVAPEGGMIAFAGAAAGGLAVLVWWLFFSRAPWPERLGAIVLMVAAVAATYRLVHPSIATGHMGMTLVIYSIPALSLALVAWAVASRRFSTGMRRLSLVATILVACGVFTLIRTDGIWGEGKSEFHWRWTPTAEERLLAWQPGPPPGPATPPAAGAAGTGLPIPPDETRAEEEPPAGAVDPTAAIDIEKPAEAPAPGERTVTPAGAWPGFRGQARDGVARGVRTATDWSQTPPVELWRRPVGPAWSSFAVSGRVAYTQEQRGDDEIVSAYDVVTGQPVWSHGDKARFWESNAGAGPRGTPTLGNGRVYTLGATGIVNALDARTGAVVWSRNAATDTGVEVPGWGFAGSPLVVGGLVVVAASGRLAAYDAATGTPRWLGPAEGGGGYSSPHLATIQGVEQILLQRGGGVLSVAPADGSVLWQHVWEPGASIVQPALTAEGDVLISGGDAMGGIGIRRLKVTRGAAGWSVEERWSSRGLKPYFNDFVVHDGYAFGFDGSILSCIDLADGARRWKGGRYGQGQLVLLPDQDLFLVLAEEGDLALVKAAPDGFAEVARVPAIEGKTWNHPALAGDILLVRNGEEMAAFRLPLAPR
jgi:outer membrane protein assembly factor BamB